MSNWVSKMKTKKKKPVLQEGNRRPVFVAKTPLKGGGLVLVLNKTHVIGRVLLTGNTATFGQRLVVGITILQMIQLLGVRHGTPLAKMTSRMFFASLLLVSISGVQSSLIIEVLTYPGRIYTNAPAGTEVLKVNAYDNVTKTPFQSLVLSTGSNSTYFKIDRNGTLLTRKRINLPIGAVLQFFVFGAISGKTNYKHIKVIVSRRNLFAPQFVKSEYHFTAYRYGVNSTVGRVKARDADPDRFETPSG
ncbi:uncharacterized protein LOC121368457 [Gigantopelta aegis]|uniref:uncharacterized protein LOC121368457 n=1 Tax=Gigantopelta aegis TaxID=1735272 RepID=UPI001B88D19A|nr:uncharacterized protein LOC121368457 [Gigantopelta aegis]